MMLAMSKGGLRVGRASHYYAEKYTQDDYHSKEQDVTGEWFGQGAERLGLAGSVRQEDFTSVLGGNDPRTGESLVGVSTRGDERRAGWDATFNAPKSVSIQALVGDDERLIAAHHKATSAALTELERSTQSRQHGGAERVNTENMVAAQFTHVAARPSQQHETPDPHLHTHVVVANMTQREDGQWRSVEPLELYRAQDHVTAVYRTELAKEVQAAGYEITVTGHKGEWELKGYDRGDVLAFSGRRQDIERHLKEQGIEGPNPKAAEIAALATRGEKIAVDGETLKGEWKARAHERGLDVEHMTTQTYERGTRTQTQELGNARASVNYAREHLTERDAVMDNRRLEVEALWHGMGKVTLSDVRQEIQTQEQHGTLIAVQHERLPRGGYTTNEMLTLERENIALMKETKGSTHGVAEADEVKTWAEQKGLNAEQTAVITQTLTSSDWLTAVEGRAGATKTTTIGALREFAQDHGTAVYGFGPTTGSVRALEEAGVMSRTVASLTTNGVAPGEGKGQLWVVDESSLLSTRQVNDLLREARTAQVDRVVFVGDQRQHGAVEAGRPVAQMQEAGMATASLNVIRRQRDHEVRYAVELASKGYTGAAVRQLKVQGRVHDVTETGQRYEAIAKEYAKSVEAGKKTLVVSPANDERQALNVAIRSEMQTRGKVATEEHAHQVLTNRNLTKAQKAHAGAYDKGDVVQYHRGSRQAGIAAHSYARVERVDAPRNQLTVQTEKGEHVTYTPSRLKGVEVFKEEERAFAAGDRIQFKAIDKGRAIANGALGTIEKLEPDGQATVRMDSGKEFSAKLQTLRHIEHGYATTSHSSQGATVDTVLVNVDTERSATLVNQKQLYVSISRARHDAQIYTNDKEALEKAVSRDVQKSTALEAVRDTKQHAWRQGRSNGQQAHQENSRGRYERGIERGR
jgi:conjugative relaxase-like TrwC/TraI family protein